MHPLSNAARIVLDRLDLDRRYELSDLRVLLPDATVENLRDVMHELWVNRHVERVGHSAWQRYRSSPPHQVPSDGRPTKVVKPEDLFDHGTFSDFFK